MNLESSTKVVDVQVVKVNFVEFERKQRQFLNELAMKRSQVEELKAELSSAKLKIHEQNRMLESAKNTIDEQEYNLSLALKNSKFLEETLQSRKDSASRTHLQQEAAIAERESLRELLQKTELKNYNLICEVNELKAQHNCDASYQKELISKDAKIREKITELNEALSNLAIDQKELIEVSSQIEVCQQLEKAVEFYREEFYKSKKKYKELEEKYVRSKATVDEFERLCNESKVFEVTQNTQALDSLEHCEQTIKLLKDQLSKQEDNNINLTKNILFEKENNMKLCLREKDLETRIEQLVAEKRKLEECVQQFENKGKRSVPKTNT